MSNKLMKDDTGQSIASAITALATSLGTDKANRDASNITDASAWRSAIGLQVRSSSVSATSNSNGNITTSLNTADYIVLGFVLENTSTGYFILNSYNGKIVIHVTDSTGSSLGNTAIEGTLYLLRISDLS